MTQLVHDLIKHKGGKVESTSPETSVDAAIVHMTAKHIGSLLVISNGELVGIITERDMLARVLAARRDPLTTFVREVMTRDLIVIRPHDTIARALAIVSDCRCRHLPVVEGGKLLGLISSGDLTAWLVRDQRQTIDDLHQYITR
ncbi:MAG: CBS domain-containing protein [Kofleriaceae bacterium]